MSIEPLIVQLSPDGRGGSLRERLAIGADAIDGHARLSYLAVIVAIVPTTDDDRPAELKLRQALKVLKRTAGLRASWPTPKLPPRQKSLTRRTLSDDTTPSHIATRRRATTS